MWGLGRWLAAGIVIAIGAVVAWQYAVRWHPAVEDYPVQGVDISAAAGTIDWATAKANGVDFAYLLASSGDAGRDPAFEDQWRALAGGDIRRGAIHAYSLCRLAADQADHFNAMVPRAADALPAAIAFAFSPHCGDRPPRNVLLREIETFMERVERHTGQRVLIRVSPDFEAEYALTGSVDRTFWATRGWFRPDYLARPWRMWQANAARRAKGFEHPVAWDVVAM